MGQPTQVPSELGIRSQTAHGFCPATCCSLGLFGAAYRSFRESGGQRNGCASSPLVASTLSYLLGSPKELGTTILCALSQSPLWEESGQVGCCHSECSFLLSISTEDIKREINNQDGSRKCFTTPLKLTCNSLRGCDPLFKNHWSMGFLGPASAILLVQVCEEAGGLSGWETEDSIQCMFLLLDPLHPTLDITLVSPVLLLPSFSLTYNPPTPSCLGAAQTSLMWIYILWQHPQIAWQQHNLCTIAGPFILVGHLTWWYEGPCIVFIGVTVVNIIAWKHLCMDRECH